MDEQQLDATLGRASACADCELVLEEVLRFGSESGPDAFTSNLAFAVSESGEIYLSGSHAAGEIQVFTKSGEFIRAFGRKGQGPAEHEVVSRLRVAGNGDIMALDPRLIRVTRFSVKGTFLGSVRTARRALDFLDAGTDSLIVAAVVPIGDRQSLPLHLIVEGRILKSFGDSTHGYGTYHYGPFRALAPALADGEFWAAHRIRYRLERWSTEGSLLGAIDRSASWFDNGTRLYASPAAARPLTEVRAVEQDESGRLWVLITTADPAWRPSEHKAPVEGGGEIAVVKRQDANRVHDTVVEVLDSQSGQVLASGRTDLALTWVGNMHVASYAETEDGVPLYRIFRLAIR